MQRITHFLIIIGYCIFLIGCMTVAMSGAGAAYDHNNVERKASDYYTTMQINANLEADSDLANQANISASSFHHIVLLTGQAPTPALRQRAVEIAQDGPDVIRIYNCITMEPPVSMSTRMDDTWITTKIKAKLAASKDIDPGQIKVVTEDGTVYLMGIVTRDQADIAVDMARDTEGVQEVTKIFNYMIMPDLSS